MTRQAVWRDPIGPVYGRNHLCRLLGVTDHQLGVLVAEQDVLAVETADGMLVYPAFQFRDNKPTPGLRDVLQAFPDNDLRWAVASWLRKPLAPLDGQSVMDVLQTGHPSHLPLVANVARRTAARWTQ